MRTRSLVTRSDGQLSSFLDLHQRDTTTGSYNLIVHRAQSATGTNIVKTTDDVVTPDFKERSARGEIINNPFYSYQYDIAGPGFTEVNIRRETSYPVQVQGKPYNYVYSWVGDQQYHGPVPWVLAALPAECAGLLDTVRDLAVTSAHAKVNDAEMQALATIAESGKTVSFFYQTLRKATQIFRAVRRLDVRAAKNLVSPRELEDLYMSYRYALRPLMYDVNDLTAALQKERASGVRQTSRGWAQESASGSETTGPYSQTDYTYCNYVQDWTYNVSARAGVLCDVTVAADTAFGLTDVLEAGWEVLPFSFIADWFANFGETLAAWTPNMRADQLASWVTTKQRFESVIIADPITDPFTPDQYTVSNQCTVLPGGYVGKELVLQREIDPQLSVFPTVEVRLDSLKILDLVIVLRSLLGLRR